MTKVKKILSGITVFVMSMVCILSFAFSAGAEGTAKVYPVLSYGKDGSYVIDVVGEDINGATAITITAYYDGSKLKYTKSKMGDILSDGLKVDNNLDKESKYIITFASTSGLSESGTITSIGFDQLGNDGEQCEIRLEVNQLTNAANEEMDRDVQNYTLTLGAEAEGEIGDIISSQIDYDKNLNPNTYGINPILTLAINGSIDSKTFLNGKDFEILGTADANIASFENGKINGINRGNTIIYVQTPDGVMGVDVVVAEKTTNTPDNNNNNNNSGGEKKMKPIAIGGIIVVVVGCVLYIIIAPDDKKKKNGKDNNKDKE